jgi:hypothetical protein
MSIKARPSSSSGRHWSHDHIWLVGWLVCGLVWVERRAVCWLPSRETKPKPGRESSQAANRPPHLQHHPAPRARHVHPLQRPLLPEIDVQLAPVGGGAVPGGVLGAWVLMRWRLGVRGGCLSMAWAFRQASLRLNPHV